MYHVHFILIGLLKGVAVTLLPVYTVSCVRKIRSGYHEGQHNDAETLLRPSRKP
jgi:hypothetical protein